MRFDPYGKISPEMEAEATTLRNLARTTQFTTALNTEIGKVLFNDLVLLLDEKFKLIYNEDATEQDKAIFKACKIIGNRWNKLIEGHDKNLKKYKLMEAKKNKEAK